MLGREKSPQERIRKAEKEKAKLRDKRSKATSEAAKMKINKKIHVQNVEIDIAKTELTHPAQTTNNKTTNINTSFSASYNPTNSGLHIHGHFHNDKKKKK